MMSRAWQISCCFVLLSLRREDIFVMSSSWRCFISSTNVLNGNSLKALTFELKCSLSDLITSARISACFLRNIMKMTILDYKMIVLLPRTRDRKASFETKNKSSEVHYLAFIKTDWDRASGQVFQEGLGGKRAPVRAARECTVKLGRV